MTVLRDSDIVLRPAYFSRSQAPAWERRWLQSSGFAYLCPLTLSLSHEGRGDVARDRRGFCKSISVHGSIPHHERKYREISVAKGSNVSGTYRATINKVISGNEYTTQAKGFGCRDTPRGYPGFGTGVTAVVFMAPVGARHAVPMPAPPPVSREGGTPSPLFFTMCVDIIQNAGLSPDRDLSMQRRSSGIIGHGMPCPYNDKGNCVPKLELGNKKKTG